MYTTYVNPHVDAIWQEHLDLTRTELLFAYVESNFLSLDEWAQAAKVDAAYMHSLVKEPYEPINGRRIAQLYSTAKGQRLSEPVSEEIIEPYQGFELRWIVEHQIPSGERIIIDNVGFQKLIKDAFSKSNSLGDRQEGLLGSGRKLLISYSELASAKRGHLPNQKKSKGPRPEKLDKIVQSMGDFVYADRPDEQRTLSHYYQIIRQNSAPQTRLLNSEDLLELSKNDLSINSGIRSKQQKFKQPQRLPGNLDLLGRIRPPLTPSLPQTYSPR